MVESRFPNAPPKIKALPVDRRGYPVPWFTPWVGGEPEFRAVYPDQAYKAHKAGKCWICGQRNQGAYAFVIGPMCAINRVSSEPPSHLDCGRFAVTACPFLSRPLAKRRDVSDIPHQPPPGVMLERNPGVSLIWVTRSYRFETEPNEPTNGLFRIGSPIKPLEWYSEGRKATRKEVLESIESGLPKLTELALLHGEAGLEALRKQIERAMKLVLESTEREEPLNV